MIYYGEAKPLFTPDKNDIIRHSLFPYAMIESLGSQTSDIICHLVGQYKKDKILALNQGKANKISWTSMIQLCNPENFTCRGFKQKVIAPRPGFRFSD
jgi:hypothetical protein